MNIKDVYEQIGGSYESAKSRMLKDTLVARFVQKFPSDETYQQLENAVAAKDWDAAFFAAHTLKGLTLNLGFERLGNITVAMTDALRTKNREKYTPAAFQMMLEEVQIEYNILIQAIAAYQAQNSERGNNGDQTNTSGDRR